MESSSSRNRGPTMPDSGGGSGGFPRQVVEKTKYAFSDISWKIWAFVGVAALIVGVFAIISIIAIALSVSTSRRVSSLVNDAATSPALQICPDVSVPSSNAELFFNTDGCAGVFSTIYRDVFTQETASGAVTIAPSATTSLFSASCPADSEAIAGSCYYTQNTATSEFPQLAYSETRLTTNQHFCRWANSGGNPTGTYIFRVRVMCRVQV